MWLQSSSQGDETLPAVELKAGNHDTRIIGRSQKLEKNQENRFSFRTSRKEHITSETLICSLMNEISVGFLTYRTVIRQLCIVLSHKSCGKLLKQE